MISVGIQLDPRAFKAVALDSHLEWLGKKYCRLNRQQTFYDWIGMLQWDLNEKAVAFFDEWEICQLGPVHGPLFTAQDALDKLYLVNHRKLISLIEVLSAYQSHALGKPVLVNKAFVLACAGKIISKKYLYRWKPDEDRPIEWML